jgi:hypothetical protein
MSSEHVDEQLAGVELWALGLHFIADVLRDGLEHTQTQWRCASEVDDVRASSDDPLVTELDMAGRTYRIDVRPVATVSIVRSGPKAP